MDSHFLALMPHVVTLEPVTTYSAYGVPEYGTATDVQALVAPTRQRIVAPNGTEIVARGVAYCAGPLIVAEDSVVTVPVACGLPTRMPVLRASPYTGLDGAVHNVEVWF